MRVGRRRCTMLGSLLNLEGGPTPSQQSPMPCFPVHAAPLHPIPHASLRELHAQVMSMIPGFSNAIMQPGSEKESQAKLKRFMTIMDSMTAKELDSSSTKIFSEPSR